jgi:hypothetical protein
VLDNKPIKTAIPKHNLRYMVCGSQVSIFERWYVEPSKIEERNLRPSFQPPTPPLTGRMSLSVTGILTIGVLNLEEDRLDILRRTILECEWKLGVELMCVKTLPSPHLFTEKELARHISGLFTSHHK